VKIILAILATLFIGRLAPDLNNQTQAQIVQQVAVEVQPTEAVVPEPTPVIEPVQVQETPETVETPVYAPLTDNEAKNYIYMHESSMRLDAVNPIGCIGLGQNCPDKNGNYWLKEACPDWQTNYICQDNAFTNYAVVRYGSWNNAYNFWLRNHWW
jgi:hypothetical protein